MFLSRILCSLINYDNGEYSRSRSSHPRPFLSSIHIRASAFQLRHLHISLRGNIIVQREFRLNLYNSPCIKDERGHDPWWHATNYAPARVCLNALWLHQAMNRYMWTRERMCYISVHILCKCLYVYNTFAHVVIYRFRQLGVLCNQICNVLMLIHTRNHSNSAVAYLGGRIGPWPLWQTNFFSP